MSLKQTILNYLEKNGRLTLQELESLCKLEMKKLSNGERRLRELMAANPAIRPEKNPHGAIIAYRYETQQGGEAATRWPHKPEIAGAIPAPVTNFDVERWNSQFKRPVEEKVEQRLF